MSYFDVFITMTGIAVGLLIGCAVTLSVFHAMSKGSDKWRVKHQLAKEKKQAKEEEEKERKRREEAENASLASRLQSRRDNSWTEFNCSTDGVDESDYIRNMQKKEDTAYQYAKSKE